MNNSEKRAAAKTSDEGYIATVESLEPHIHSIDASAYYASAAISLKRIADALEQNSKYEEIEPPAIVSSYLQANNLIVVRRR